MPRTSTEQRAFTWSAETAHEVPTGGLAAEAIRPGAPPMVRGGGARRAAGGTVMVTRVERPRPTIVPPDPLPPDNELWDVRAAARFLKRSVSWVYHKAEDGTLPVKRLAGWGVRFVPADLRSWVGQHTKTDGER